MGLRGVFQKNSNGDFGQLEKKVQKHTQLLEGMDQLQENVRNLNALVEGLPQLYENVRNLNALVEGLPQLYENVRNLNTLMEGLPQLYENVRNNNHLLEVLVSQSQMHGVKIMRLEKQKKQQDSISSDRTDSSTTGSAAAPVQDGDEDYGQIDYFDFENYFRGTRAAVRQAQMQYLPFFENCRNVVDLGCGRGEFLEILQENKIGAVGVDFYPEFADYCNEQGFTAVCEDAISYLEQLEAADGIFAGQLVEHLTTSQLIRLCELSYEKLEKGGYVILETPNPFSLSIYTHAFYIDPSHEKPVHPYTLKYFLEKAGFRSIQTLYTPNSRRDIEIPPIVSDSIQNLEEFNAVMKQVSEVLFGSQDYAMIARK